MAAANLIASFEAKFDVQNAKFDAMQSELRGRRWGVGGGFALLQLLA